LGALNLSTIVLEEMADIVGDGGGEESLKDCCSGLSVLSSSSLNPPGSLGVSSRVESDISRGGGMLGPRAARVVLISPARDLSMVY
jgi:hypothetical protein